MAIPPKAIAVNKFVMVAAVAACIMLAAAAAAFASAPNARYDRFGIREIYPSKAGGQEWYLNSTNPRDGMFVISPAATSIYRMHSNSSFLISRETAGPNDGVRMYVESPSMWRDVEMTGYVRLWSFSFEEEFAWAARSGKHSETNACDATAYFGALGFLGNSWFQKKVFHGDGYTGKRFSAEQVEPLVGRWVGIKLVAYDINDGRDVKLELWVDNLADNNWVKAAETIDSGGWSSKVAKCSRAHDHIISDERPRVMFRVDNATFEFMNFSVREIRP